MPPVEKRWKRIAGMEMPKSGAAGSMRCERERPNGSSVHAARGTGEIATPVEENMGTVA
jgi:hypothetical protein